MAASSITNEIIITAMDRFVWFVLLIVASHLVTEFTRVTGYARGNRHDVVLINDSLIQPMPVANMIYYPGQEYGLYEQSSNSNNYYYNGQNSNNNGNHNNNAQQNSAVITAPASGQTLTGFNFSFRPLIDSIFEIPISTLRAVNDLVARLTGSYQHQTVPVGAAVIKSATGDANLNGNMVNSALPAFRSYSGQVGPAAATGQSGSMSFKADSSQQIAQDGHSADGANSSGSNKVFVVGKAALREVRA